MATYWERDVHSSNGNPSVIVILVITYIDFEGWSFGFDCTGSRSLFTNYFCHIYEQ